MYGLSKNPGKVYGSDKPATPNQLKYIASLSAKLGMPEPKVYSYAEAGRMIRELKAESNFRDSVKRNSLARLCYNTLAEHGYRLHYINITAFINARKPGIKATPSRVLAALNARRDLFKKMDAGIYWIANKQEGVKYPEI